MHQWTDLNDESSQNLPCAIFAVFSPLGLDKITSEIYLKGGGLIFRQKARAWGKRTVIAAANAATGRGAPGGVSPTHVADPTDGSLAPAARAEHFRSLPMTTLLPSSAPSPAVSWRTVGRKRVAEFSWGSCKDARQQQRSQENRP